MKKGKTNINAKDYWDKKYASLGKEWRIFPYERIYEVYLKGKEYKTIADYGCGLGDGIGYLIDKFPRTRFFGLDFSEIAIKICQEKYPHFGFGVIDFNKKFFPIKADLALVVQTLEHLEKPMEFLERIKNRSKEVLISLPLDKHPEGEHYHSFEIGDFKNIKFKHIDKEGAIIVL